jgi:hypothetical protein
MTKEEIRISKEALFKGVSTRFGLRTIEMCFENPDFFFCSSFQNLRLGSINLLHSIMSESSSHCPIVRGHVSQERCPTWACWD